MSAADTSLGVLLPSSLHSHPPTLSTNCAFPSIDKMVPTKRNRSTYLSPGSTIVTLKASAGAVSFYIHHELLCGCSEFFQAGFKGGFKDATDKAITLKDTSRSTMQLFMEWLHSDEIVPITDSEEPTMFHSDDILDLYVFRDR